MKENFPNLLKKIYMQVQKAQRVSNKMYVKRPAPGYIIITMPKVEDGGEIGGSGVHFPLVKHLADLLRNRANSQQSSSI